MKYFPRSTVVWFGILAFLVGGVFSQATSVEARNHADSGGVWQSEPIYHPETGSYFQLAQIQARGGERWEQVNTRAQNMEHQGRQGRLAVLDTPEVYHWVREKLLLGKTPPKTSRAARHSWIGLRYWCRLRELTWTVGSAHPFNSFAPWTSPWYGGRSNQGCNRNAFPYMGVYLEASSYQWKAHGFPKFWHSFIVEYPEEN